MAPRVHGPARGAAALTPQRRRDKERELALLRGKPGGYVDARPAREHVRSLVSAGFSQQSIAESAGLSHATLLWIMSRSGRCRAETLASIMAVTPKMIISSRSATQWVPAIGSQRRITALRAVGHGYVEVTAAMHAAGHPHRADLVMRRRFVTKAIHLAVKSVYDELWDKPGDNRLVRMRALRDQLPPPMSWDDDDIDDPAARPAGAYKARHGLRMEDVEDLIDVGENWESLARILGVLSGSIRTLLARHKRHDLILHLDARRVLAS